MAIDFDPLNTEINGHLIRCSRLSSRVGLDQELISGFLNQVIDNYQLSGTVLSTANNCESIKDQLSAMTSLSLVGCWQEKLNRAELISNHLLKLSERIGRLSAYQLSQYGRLNFAPIGSFYEQLFRLLSVHNPADRRFSKDLLDQIYREFSTLGCDPEISGNQQNITDPELEELMLCASLRLQDIANSMDARASKIAGKTADAEFGQLKIQRVREEIDELFAECFSHMRCPEFILDFAVSHLKSELQYLKTQPSVSRDLLETWQFILRALASIIKMVAEDQDKVNRQKLVNVVSSVLEHMSRMEQPSTITAPVSQDFFNRLNEFLVAVLSGNRPKLPSRILELPATPIKLKNNRRRALKIADRFEASWYLFVDGEHSRCGRLLDDHRFVSHCCFVDQQGLILRTETVDKFEQLLALGVVSPLTYELPMESTIARITKAFTWLQDKLALKLKALNEQAEEVRRAEEQREAELRRERKLAAIKAREEAERIAQAERELEQKRRAERESRLRQEQESRERHAYELLERIKVGSLLAIKPPGRDESISARLAVLIPSTERYIFVDRIGTKVLEVNREELFQYCLDQRVIITGQTSSFESQLERVVSGIKSKGKAD